MPLTPGTRLGPYEIIAPLGTGGMGEVYRARDSRLGRDVAVKVLPPHLSANPEVRARFEREAKTVSSLNHPNICTLFDVGREGDTDYLVMELIEGETLAQRLAKGALPGPDVLKLGVQIADALDRAHGAGVIHRDLKPGNVMLAKSGAKLMDFGLARATGTAGPGGGSGITHAALTQSPTVAAPLTAKGTIVGTFQYMAPEQLEGKEADARSDIWALGCVLYEMATGRRAFEGRSQASLIHAIMGSDPTPISQLAPLAPPGLDRLVRTCMTKDADERVQTAHDVKLQLQGLGEGGSQAGEKPPAAGRHRLPARLPWAVAAAFALAAAALAFLLISREAAPTRAVQLTLPPPEAAQFADLTSGVAISPDGRSVAYCAADSSGGLCLWLEPLDAPEPRRLATLPRHSPIFWAPDSRTVGFMLMSEGKLMTVPVTGGAAVAICAAPSARGATWNRQGVILLAPFAQGPLFRVSASGGEPIQVSWPDSSRHSLAHRFPWFLPDGEHFLFASEPPGPEGFDIYAGSLGSLVVKKIMTAGSAPVYAEPGYLVFRRQNKIMAQRFDARRLELEGDPVALSEAPPITDMDAEPVASASTDGKLVFLSSRAPDTRLGWFDRSGALRGTLALPAGRWGRPVLSPDDRFAAVQNGDDLWRVDLARSVAVRLTSNGGQNVDPVWSPDGSRIAFTRRQMGRNEILIMNSDGSGQAQVLPTTPNLFKTPEDWTREGLVFTDIGTATFRDLWLAHPSGGGAPAPLIQTPFSEYLARVSPDGSWIAYVSNEAGPEDVYIQSFPVSGHKLRVSTGGALRPHWMPGSDEVFYETMDRRIVSVKLTRKGNDLDAGEPRASFMIPPGLIGADFTHDGQRMLVSFSSAEAQERSVRVILDWTALVKR
jgi:eukaryotic-like serine/threonine-protein kinase